jgi:hypothetical protein
MEKFLQLIDSGSKTKLGISPGRQAGQGHARYFKKSSGCEIAN